MGFFSLFSSSELPSDSIRPVSLARLSDLFERRQWTYTVTEEGLLQASWSECLFAFSFESTEKEVLSIYSHIHKPIPEEHLEDLETFIEDWHRDYLWPKAYHTWSAEGELYVETDLSIDYEYGATDAQLFTQISCAVSTTLQLYKALEDRFSLSKD